MTRDEDREALEAAQRKIDQARANAPGRRPDSRKAGEGPLAFKDPEDGKPRSTEGQRRFASLVKELTREAVEQGVQNVHGEMVQAVIGAHASSIMYHEDHPEAWEEHQARERERKAEDLRRRLTACRFPRKAVEAIVTGQDQHGKALQDGEVDGWIDDRMTRGALLLALGGLVGTGKTFAACRWAATSKLRPLYLLAREFYTLSPNYDPDRPMLKRAATAQLLILDELGTGEEGDRESARIEALLHQRFEHDLPTIAIGNLLQQEFADRYTDRVMSRLWEAGGLKFCKDIMRAGERRRQKASR